MGYVKRSSRWYLIGRVGFPKRDNAARAVHLGVDGILDDKLTDLLLRLNLVQVDELRQALQRDELVVLGHHLEILHGRGTVSRTRENIKRGGESERVQ